jgi:16S rRNA (guanine527-N7)-methyltransferase
MKNIKFTNVDVSRETLTALSDMEAKNKAKLSEYAKLLLDLNKRVNLVSRGMGENELWGHIRHCLWLTVSHVWEDGTIVIDAGSGGGLPGIVLGITHPQKKIILVDIVEKKVLASKQMIRQLGLTNVSAIQSDIKDFGIEETGAILVSKHAFKMPELLAITKSEMFRNIILLKGADYASELDQINEDVNVGVINIDDHSQDVFFTGKRVLTIERP